MTTPYPTEGDPAPGTADAGPDDVAGATPASTETAAETSGETFGQTTGETSEPQTGETTDLVPVGASRSSAAQAAETTELDRAAITGRLGADGADGTEGLSTEDERRYPGDQAPTATLTSPVPAPGVTGAPSTASGPVHGPASAPASDPEPTSAFTPLPTSVPTPPPTTAADAPRRRGARMGTVVWGILLAAIGAGIVARGLGVRFDVELALIVVLCVMGGALLVGSVVAGIRKT